MAENWIYNNKTTTEKDFYGLEKAKRQEESRIKEGWRYYKITPRHKILVPYKDGHPTEEGKKLINNYMELLGLIK